MKKTFIYFSTLLIAALSLPVSTSAQSVDYPGVVINKTVTPDETDSYKYTLTLETYVTGDEIHSATAMDVVMVLDLSQSMSEISAPVTSDYVLAGTKEYNFVDLTGMPKDDQDVSHYKQTGRPTISSVTFKKDKSTTVTTEGIITDFAFDNGSNLCYILVARQDGVTYILYHDISTNTTTMLAYNSSTKNVKTGEITLYKAKDGATPASKVNLMKRAAKSFADILSNNAKSNDVNHRLGIVRFADSGYKSNASDISEDADYTPKAVVAKQLISLNETGTTNLNAVKTAIDQLTHAGQTYPSYGFNLASALYNQQGSSSKKTILFLTDGEPGSGDFREGTANEAVSAISSLKDAGATVYSVGIFDKFSNKTATYNFMNAVSSNYPHASSYNVSDNTAHDYFRVVGEKSLEEIFSDIAEEVVSGSASVEMNASNSEVRDFLADGFNFPAGATASSVTVNAYKCTGYSSNQYTFTTTATDPKTLKNSSGTTVSLDVNAGSVIVSGFDYAANYVRAIKKSGQPDTYDGYKLVFSFPIVVDMEKNQGGNSLETNTTQSGIYYDATGSGKEIINGGVPSPEVKLPNIVVKIIGMEEGESAIFRVQKLESDNSRVDPVDIVLIADEDGNAKAVVTKKVPGRYVVEEIASWDWIYNTTAQATYTDDDKDKSDTDFNTAGFGPKANGYAYEIPFKKGTEVDGTSIIRNVNEFTNDETLKGTPFIFERTLKTDLPRHKEKTINNEFDE